VQVTDDLVQRLKSAAEIFENTDMPIHAETLREAASRIEALERQVRIDMSQHGPDADFG
jgi:hypothetical protein